MGFRRMIDDREAPPVLRAAACDGWAELPSDIDLLEFAGMIGIPIPARPGGPLAQTLRPTLPELAPPRSMSASFGTGEFPFHTDGACMRLPPRWTLLRALIAEESMRPTFVHNVSDLPLSQRELQALRVGVWRVTGGATPFLTSVLTAESKIHAPRLRFDPCCMSPVTPEAQIAQQALEACVARRPPVRVRWRTGMTIILDNWRALHGRGCAPPNGDGHRALLRVLVCS